MEQTMNPKILKLLTAGALAAGTAFARADATVPTRVPVDADGVQRVTIVGGSYFFRPALVIVRADVPVELTVSAEPGVVPHSFEIDAPQAGIAVHTELATTPRTLRFTPTQPVASPTIARTGCCSCAAIASAAWRACWSSRRRRDRRCWPRA
jgi:hypothetical protein